MSEDVAIEGLEVEVHQLYRAMDFLLQSSNKIQREVYCSISNPLNLEVNLLHFDTTSTYFEVEMSRDFDSFRQYGYSREGQTFAVQGFQILVIPGPVGDETLQRSDTLRPQVA